MDNLKWVGVGGGGGGDYQKVRTKEKREAMGWINNISLSALFSRQQVAHT